MKRNQKGFAHLFLLLIVVIAVIAGAAYYVYKSQSKTSNNTNSPSGVSTGKQLAIPSSVLANKFGWLTGYPDSEKEVKDLGGAWARPHPGPFLWDTMQKSAGAEIDFSVTDRAVKENQDSELATLATIWPFAEWDQGQRAECAVSDQDEFLPKGGDIPYLPKHRCNPTDTQAYKEWVQAVVERYDGDGQSDMPGLKTPVKYWEAMNEPDLSQSGGPAGELSFYQQGPSDYAKLLIATSQAVKAADPNAKVLIAGAAGGNDNFLGFYRKVLANKQAVQAFDIGNVHCISNDSYQSFNVEPYKQMLKQLGVNKPVWVTEAEAVISDNPDINATQTLLSTKQALKAGAQRIFFTRFDFNPGGPGGGFAPPGVSYPEVQISGSDPEKAYSDITSQ